MTTATQQANSRRWVLPFLAALVAVLATIFSSATASATPSTAAGTRVGAHDVAGEVLVEPPEAKGPGQRLGKDVPGPGMVVATGVAAKTGDEGLSAAYHYTRAQNVASIESKGLLKGGYATPDGSLSLSPLQAQIDLALPPNRGLPGALVRVDVAGLRSAGYEIPRVNQVGRSFGMPGGGYEMQFPYAIPPEFLKVIR